MYFVYSERYLIITSLMICPISEEFILTSCVITIDVAYWRIPVTIIEICWKITVY